MKTESNSLIALMLKALGIAEIIGGIITGVVAGDFMANEEFQQWTSASILCCIISIGTGFMFGMLLIAGGQVVQLLTDIRDSAGMKRTINESRVNEANLESDNTVQSFNNLPKL